MTDASALLPRPSEARLPPEGAPPKASLAGRLAGAVARHAHLALAVIVVLAILVVGLYVYYHGLFFLGPYAAKGAPRDKKGRDAGDEAQADPETERLIDSINQR